MRVGFLGTGEIATALVTGLAGRGHQILVSRRNAGMSDQLRNRFEDVEVAENFDVVENSDIIFLCLMADVAKDALGCLPWREDHAIISAMVDVSLDRLSQYCDPATDISLTIPLSPVATGGSVLPVFPVSHLLDVLFGETNTVIPVSSERALNVHFAGSALSAPLIALMQTGAAWLAEETGDAQAAEQYVAGVFAGFLSQMAIQKVGFDTLLEGLATEGGLNASLKKHLEKSLTHNALRDGLDALKPRLGLE